jgi:hypothetical protein
MAMRSAANTDPDVVASHVLPLLRQLEDPAYASAVDPEDEIRGTVLRLVWPQYISFSDIQSHLLKKPAEHFFGAFYLFLSSFGRNMSQSQIREALLWAPSPPHKVTNWRTTKMLEANLGSWECRTRLNRALTSIS